MPFPYFDETLVLNEEARKDLPGSFISLPNGVTHYEKAGNENRGTVVFVHGFSVPYFIFDPTFDFLTQQGFRTVRYDLFGRGFSDRPHIRYDMAFFVRQLKDLLDILRIKSTNLIGLSMGGPISTCFTEAFPDMVEKHIMIDPAGARPISLSPLLNAVKIPVIGELTLGLFGTGNMVKNAASDMFTPKLVEEFQDKYKVQMQYHGFKRAILSSLRNGMLDSFIDSYKKVGKLMKPTLLFWGRQDATVPFEHSTDILNAIPHAELHVFEKCGHIPHYEYPDEVNKILLEFLRR